MIAKTHSFVAKILNVAQSKGQKSTNVVDRIYQTVLEAF